MEIKPFQSEHIGELIASFALAQLEYPDIPKSKKGGEKGGKTWYYADLPQILETIRPILNKHGLTFHQSEQFAQDCVFLITQISHKVSGQWIGSFKPLKTKSATDQDYGSAVSYQRRYSAMAILGIHPSDEDLDNPAINDNRSSSKQWSSNTQETYVPYEESIEEVCVITPEQVAQLEKESTPELLKKVLGFRKINSLQELPAEYFANTIDYFKKNKKQTLPF